MDIMIIISPIEALKALSIGLVMGTIFVLVVTGAYFIIMGGP